MPDLVRDTIASWIANNEQLLTLAQHQLFFIGGAPRSGTTWLQLLLNSHPQICCRGEALFGKRLADPLDQLIKLWRDAVQDKNTTIFRTIDGYQPPETDDADLLLGTAVLSALHRQCAGQIYRAIGEKTPENVFLFPRLKRLFPTAKFIGIARDPRDVLTSAWHFFHAKTAATNVVEAKTTLIRNALPALLNGTRAMLALQQQYGSDCLVVTYERLSAAPAQVAAELFEHLGVTADTDIVAACVSRTAFPVLAAAHGKEFFRSGHVGTWRATFTPEMCALIARELGWMYPHFGWEL